MVFRAQPRVGPRGGHHAMEFQDGAMCSSCLKRCRLGRGELEALASTLFWATGPSRAKDSQRVPVVALTAGG
jgi:hypothetical protein